MMHALVNLHTFHLNAHASTVLELQNEQQLREIDWQKPYLILGEGSNQIFVSDYHGCLLVNRILAKHLTEDEHYYYLRVGGGENWHQFVLWLCQQGIGGLENLALIPGTVGAAPIQNIGAYGAELADHCVAVRYFDPQSGEFTQIAASDCNFGYRDSIFKHQLRHVVITEVSFRFAKQWCAKTNYGELKQLASEASELTPLQVFERVCQVRMAKLPDPAVLGNAGSFFKNPVIGEQQFSALSLAYPEMPHYPAVDGVKLAAGWLIDQCNLKGYRLGNAAVHQAQALVLVNHGQASAAEVLQLAKHVINAVEQRFGVSLEPEVRFIAAEGEINFSDAVQRYA